VRDAGQGSDFTRFHYLSGRARVTLDPEGSQGESMNRTLFAVAGAALLPTLAQAHDMLWITQFGTKSYDYGRALAPDGEKGVFVAGTTSGQALLARYDDLGTQIWITQIGSVDYDEAFALAADGAGGTFIAGSTSGSLGGPNQGKADAWIARCDAQGNQHWISQIGSDDYEEAFAVACDDAGNAFIGGWTVGSLGGPHQGGYDAWLAGLEDSGQQVWNTQLGTIGDDQVNALAPDGAGGIFVAGYTEGSLAGPHKGSFRDAWLAHYDGSGSQTWILQLGTTADDDAVALAPDGEGGVIVAGSTAGSLGGPNQGGYDPWLAHFDASGHQIWIAQFGGVAVDHARSISSDGAGGTFIAGWTKGSLGGPSMGYWDAWLARCDATGNPIWISQLGTDQEDGADAIASDGAGGAFVAGETNASLGGPKKGKIDAWLARFGGDEPGCYPDFTGDGTLDLFDFLGYVNAFNAQDPEADCDSDGSFSLFDFLCFVNAFNEGC
jgi:hypothetical protein